ncbi:type I-C CRISPR-associated protein Cas5 [Synergistales bacterium]|nr:type I-C CRISPR-associated protein Cas5 [Synergistales bacterium]GHV51805.1 type I-C CRISPR-associated protein Cas5 [Synergistales bacterium]
MGYGVRLLVCGDYACFTRPEMKGERVSYDVITPSAARGIVEAVYWHPGLYWVVDKLMVLNEIRFDSVRRNELGGKISESNAKRAMKGGDIDLHQVITEDRQQRATLLLRDVAYVIDAHFDLVQSKMAAGDNIGKFLDQFNRRARKGQCYNQPYLGCREFSAHFKLLEEDTPPPVSFYSDVESRDLGWMLWDLEYGDTIEPKFFRAEMRRGVIDVAKAVTV